MGYWLKKSIFLFFSKRFIRFHTFFCITKIVQRYLERSFCFSYIVPESKFCTKLLLLIPADEMAKVILQDNPVSVRDTNPRKWEAQGQEVNPEQLSRLLQCVFLIQTRALYEKRK